MDVSVDMVVARNMHPGSCNIAARAMVKTSCKEIDYIGVM